MFLFAKWVDLLVYVYTCSISIGRCLSIFFLSLVTVKKRVMAKFSSMLPTFRLCPLGMRAHKFPRAWRRLGFNPQTVLTQKNRKKKKRKKEKRERATTRNSRNQYVRRKTQDTVTYLLLLPAARWKQNSLNQRQFNARDYKDHLKCLRTSKSNFQIYYHNLFVLCGVVFLNFLI